jgi:hypothetical protein
MYGRATLLRWPQSHPWPSSMACLIEYEAIRASFAHDYHHPCTDQGKCTVPAESWYGWLVTSVAQLGLCT